MQREAIDMLLEFLNALTLMISFVVLSTATVEFLSRVVSRTYLRRQPAPPARHAV
ncbi:hypothetical protein KUG85_04270 [Nitratireductor sp. L1-7-SE]|uniref:Uncharacterized protein n=1 Tax=Nitratireductor rhodophyticola TaxID=2854036 RepID=A0ABS7R6C9_9HYPH|nr:hypothetical protein [Nitratireductor rhodophyticola]MBY8915023.1 hypothetical protein [Nitratireductor rhodophyticola]MBY8919907.1 hypothetical protein [Nitratireductor rhodophyticola]